MTIVDIAPEDVQQQLERILESPFFSKAGRQSRFLRYLVEKALAGDVRQLKGYTIGLDVFDRGQDFDPSTDAIVRVEAGRLRSKVAEYYRELGSNDDIIIDLPKGNYIPQFSLREPQQITATNKAASQGLRHRIAVLPFANLSNESEQEFFVIGLTDMIINYLANNHLLRVTSFTSVMSFRNTKETIVEIGRQLGVDLIIEGSVFRNKDKVRITVQLIDTVNDTHLWAERYEEDLTDIFRLQNEVASRVAAFLDLPGLVNQVDVIDPRAFEEDLLGRHFRRMLTLDSLEKGIQHFEKSIKISPQYADAYAGMAGCYCAQGTYGLELKAPDEIIPQGIELARKAIDLNPQCTEAYAYLGTMLLKYSWDWLAAREALEKALMINPSDARALLQFGMYFESLGQFDRSVSLLEKAREVDPLARSVLLNLTWQYFQAERWSDATESMQRLQRLEPDFWGGYWIQGQLYREQGDYQSAVASLRRALAIRKNHDLSYEALGYTLGIMGEKQQALEVVERLKELATTHYVSPYRLATIYVGLEDYQQALEWLQKAFEVRARSLAWIEVAKEYAAVREIPKFKKLIDAIGIPSVQ